MLKLYSRFQKQKLFYPFRYFSSRETKGGLISQLNSLKIKAGNEKTRLDPHVFMKQDNVVYIKNINNRAKYMDLLKVDNSSAICIGIENDSAAALLLDDPDEVNLLSSADIHKDKDFKISLKNLGNVIDYLGEPLVEPLNKNLSQIDNTIRNQSIGLFKGLKKAPRKRNLVSEQLFSGHLRIDLNNPMVQNNCILLEGNREAGKNIIVKDTIKYFLSDDRENNRRVVYLTPNIGDGTSLHEKHLSEEEREKCTTIVTNDIDACSSNLYLSVRSALTIAQKLRENKLNVLFVFDKIFEYYLCEGQIFNYKTRCVAPYNIFYEIFENCGDFGPDSGRLTSMLVLDTDMEDINLLIELEKLQANIKSVSDHIISFETNIKAMNLYHPKLNLYTHTSLCADYWQKPFLSAIRKEFEEFAGRFIDSHKRNERNKDYGFGEDPWENYLYHDSRFIIPMMNNSQLLKVEEQILLFKFFSKSPIPEEKSVGWNESISEFKDDPKITVERLISFAYEYKTTNLYCIEKIRELLHKEVGQFCIVIKEDGSKYIEDVDTLNDKIYLFLQAFYEHSKVNGHLRDKRLDYFNDK